MKKKLKKTEPEVGNTIEQVEHNTELVEDAAKGESAEQAPVYSVKGKTLCDLCEKACAKAGIAKHRKLWLNKSKSEVSEHVVKTERSIPVVPVEVAEIEPPTPPKPLKVKDKHALIALIM